MTRDEMVAIIARGESVLHGEGAHRRIISRVEDLPTEAEMASGDKEGLQAARAVLASRRAAMDAEMEAIDTEVATLGSKSSAKKKPSTDDSTAGAVPPPETS